LVVITSVPIIVLFPCVLLLIFSPLSSPPHPPMNRQYLDCKCAFYPNGHLVAKTEKLKHALELKRVATQVGLFYIISHQIHLDESSPGR
jgi:hypothetical protein